MDTAVEINALPWEKEEEKNLEASDGGMAHAANGKSS